MKSVREDRGFHFQLKAGDATWDCHVQKRSD